MGPSSSIWSVANRSRYSLAGKRAQWRPGCVPIPLYRSLPGIGPEPTPRRQILRSHKPRRSLTAGICCAICVTTSKRMLHRLGPQLRLAAQRVTAGGVALGRQGLPRGAALRGWQRLSDERRARRLALYEKVMTLHTQGGTMKGIAREFSIDHRTVRKFITSSAFPERVPRARGPTPLDAHRHYIEQRIAEGCDCPRRIWHEVRQRGYTGAAPMSITASRGCCLPRASPRRFTLLGAPCRVRRPGAHSDGWWDAESGHSTSPGRSSTSGSCRRCARSNRGRRGSQPCA